ncbi:SigE family RNA polymerase sigma factor [Kitasatospora fiedleri]|uniref:SigE family RNA polymerase sigma factor n=1 Tax=Kitasatospora fiedleri TaxID=2991545 RepID=UPI002989EF65|nr:SigE family RNA polymerase sigma factor [Kitasatospora fiedleri]
MSIAILPPIGRPTRGLLGTLLRALPGTALPGNALPGTTPPGKTLTGTTLFGVREPAAEPPAGAAGSAAEPTAQPRTETAAESAAGPAAEPPALRALPGGRSGDDRERPTLTELYHAQRLPLVRLAVLLVDHQDVAEDVVQDAFTELYRKYGERMDDLDNALGYLRTSVVNGARSVLRRRRTARAYVPPHEADEPSAEDRAVLNDEHRRVLAALRELTARQREVLVLRYWSDLSETQIAETLGLARGTVKSTASRALDALERHLEKAG